MVQHEGLESPEALTEQLSQDGNWEHEEQPEQQVLRFPVRGENSKKVNWDRWELRK